MEDKFVVRPKATDKKEDKSVVLTLRMDKELREECYRRKVIVLEMS